LEAQKNRADLLRPICETVVEAQRKDAEIARLQGKVESAHRTGVEAGIDAQRKLWPPEIARLTTALEEARSGFEFVRRDWPWKDLTRANACVVMIDKIDKALSGEGAGSPPDPPADKACECGGSGRAQGTMPSTGAIVEIDCPHCKPKGDA
jgi:hypothetical protein